VEDKIQCETGAKIEKICKDAPKLNKFITEVKRKTEKEAMKRGEERAERNEEKMLPQICRKLGRH